VVVTEVHITTLVVFLNLMAAPEVLVAAHLVERCLHLAALAQQVKVMVAERRLVILVAAPVEVVLVRWAHQYQVQQLDKMVELVFLHQLLEPL
jgi:hypothetical protein